MNSTVAARPAMSGIRWIVGRKIRCLAASTASLSNRSPPMPRKRPTRPSAPILTLIRTPPAPPIALSGAGAQASRYNLGLS